MNAILTVDSTGSVHILRERLAKESHNDVLRLAAMDWVLRYRITELLPDLRRLAMPGISIPVRRKALEILEQL